MASLAAQFFQNASMAGLESTMTPSRSKMRAKMNVSYNHCLVFEDAISGIQSATSAGMFSIGIGNEKTKHDLLFHGAKDVIEDFTQISINKENITILNGKVFGLSENN